MSLASCNSDQDSIMLASNQKCRGKDQTDINGATFAPSIQCREKFEDEERLRTVECLRGRLQAERVASKSAKEETELLGKKLDELEKNLNKEIKIRNRAEKKLRHALKKLESLNILNLSESSIGSISSFSSLGNEGSEEKTFSNDNSIQCSSIGEIKEGKNGINGSKEIDLIASFSTYSSKDHSQEESSSFVGSEISQNGSNGSSKDSCSEEFQNSVRQESVSICTESERQMENEDNKLAIVLVNNEPKKENVESVLLALKQVKEKLQYSIARRSISSMKEIYGQ